VGVRGDHLLFAVPALRVVGFTIRLRQVLSQKGPVEVGQYLTLDVPRLPRYPMGVS